MGRSEHHDEISDDGEYRKRCECLKCVKKYDDWCDENECDGQVQGERKCYMICEYRYKQPKTVIKEWGHKERLEGKWEKIPCADPCPIKKKTSSCNCPKKSACTCGKNNNRKHKSHGY